MTTVVVVRHGERQDYVDRDQGKNWVQSNLDRGFDPPLTSNGLSQAKQLGQELPSILEKHALAGAKAVYSSPFLRCRQTASGILAAVDDDGTTNDNKPKVKVELGLAESINENWYRSWAIPGTDGTWGYLKKERPYEKLDQSTLHPASVKPVQGLLDWKVTLSEPSLDWVHREMDHGYISKSAVETAYCMGHPPMFESQNMQRRRMAETIELLRRGHLNETFVVVSHGKHSYCIIFEMISLQFSGFLFMLENRDTILHYAYTKQNSYWINHREGGPVTHLYEELTGNHWNDHGVSKYCSFSIYQKSKENWEPIIINQVLYENNPGPDDSKDKPTAFVWS
jgi:broad specificity phosphatase PhoE